MIAATSPADIIYEETLSAWAKVVNKWLAIKMIIINQFKRKRKEVKKLRSIEARQYRGS